ncbi:MAG TPA: DUF4417 domain-containing protein [Acidimicrobiales bacterium]|nr:DUF4417 domain-containing protein [Acidimicrobiales bacterium]
MTATIPLPARNCDCSVCPFSVDNPSAVEPICSGCSGCDYCNCARNADGMGGADACSGCNVQCGSRVDIAAWMLSVGSTLTFDDVGSTTIATPGLPSYLPVVDGDDMTAFHGVARHPAIGVGLRRIFSKFSFTMQNRWAERGAHACLGLDDDQLAVLVGSGADPLVEAFWENRKVDRLIETIAEQRWDLVLTPNPSVYLNQPRATHLLSLRRTILLASEMADAGINAAPNLYWARLEDLDRWAVWIVETDAKVLFVNAQTDRTDYDWNNLVMAGVTYLSQILDEQQMDTKVIVVGPSLPARVGQLVDVLGDRLCLANSDALLLARRGKVINPVSGKPESVGCLPPDAWQRNLAYYNRLTTTPQSVPARAAVDGA